MSEQEQLKQQIIEKAWNDPDFRKQLLDNPNEALKQSFDINIPDPLELKVVEETPTTLYLVIPPKPSESLNEQSNVQNSW